jgi:Lipopolysaccharide-assembly
MRFVSVLVAGLTLSLAGCAGYRIGPIKPKLMDGINTIAVSTFKNDTLEPRIEAQMANSIIKQVQQDGTYKIARENEADAVLEGTLDEIQRRPARSVRGNVLQTREFNLVLRVRYKVTNRRTGQQIIQRSVNGTTSFFVSGSNTIAADVNQDERQAIPIAAEDLAARLVSQISEGW